MGQRNMDLGHHCYEHWSRKPSYCHNLFVRGDGNGICIVPFLVKTFNHHVCCNNLKLFWLEPSWNKTKQKPIWVKI